MLLGEYQFDHLFDMFKNKQYDELRSEINNMGEFEKQLFETQLMQSLVMNLEFIVWYLENNFASLMFTTFIGVLVKQIKK